MVYNQKMFQAIYVGKLAIKGGSGKKGFGSPVRRMAKNYLVIHSGSYPENPFL
jgi:hypothetical protein